MKVLAFLFNHILHCICFKMLLTGSKYLVSNRGYIRLIRTIKKVKKLNRKKFKIFHVITILCNHHFILLKLIWAIKSFILYQKDQMELKLGYNFTTCDGFEPLHHICIHVCMLACHEIHAHKGGCGYASMYAYISMHEKNLIEHI